MLANLSKMCTRLSAKDAFDVFPAKNKFQKTIKSYTESPREPVSVEARILWIVVPKSLVLVARKLNASIASILGERAITVWLKSVADEAGI